MKETSFLLREQVIYLSCHDLEQNLNNLGIIFSLEFTLDPPVWYWMVQRHIIEDDTFIII